LQHFKFEHKNIINKSATYQASTINLDKVYKHWKSWKTTRDAV